MNRKKAFIFVLLLLPKIVFAEGITTAICGVVSSYLGLVFPGFCAVYIGGSVGLAGALYAPQFELAVDNETKDDHDQNPTEKIKKYVNKVSSYTCSVMGLAVGLTAGWVGAGLLYELTGEALN